MNKRVRINTEIIDDMTCQQISSSAYEWYSNMIHGTIVVPMFNLILVLSSTSFTKSNNILTTETDGNLCNCHIYIKIVYA